VVDKVVGALKNQNKSEPTFALLRLGHSASQCAAYLGLIPVEKESGSSIKGRSRLAKNGNPTIRAKLYMAAISA
jgi:transposase